VCAVFLSSKKRKEFPSPFLADFVLKPWWRLSISDQRAFFSCAFFFLYVCQISTADAPKPRVRAFSLLPLHVTEPGSGLSSIDTVDNTPPSTFILPPSLSRTLLPPFLYPASLTEKRYMFFSPRGFLKVSATSPPRSKIESFFLFFTTRKCLSDFLPTDARKQPTDFFLQFFSSLELNRAINLEGPFPFVVVSSAIKWPSDFSRSFFFPPGPTMTLGL